MTVGQITLSPEQARHARDVLRLATGTEVELFDDAGAIGSGRIVRCDQGAVVVDVAEVVVGAELGLIIASAVPKGDRADWMVEKLSEVGADRFIPLITERAVVLPEGKNKRQRWMRLATESAKQSRRAGIMKIDELTDVRSLLGGSSDGALFFTTEPDAPSMLELPLQIEQRVILLIGPEGGWSDAELAAFREAGLTGVKLTETILRVETAAVCAAAIVATMRAKRPR